MNGLSWLLYGADVALNISMSLGIITIFSILALVGFGLAIAVTAGDHYVEEETKKVFRKIVKITTIILVVTVPVLVVTPSRSTIMLIAASEVGETVLASKEAQNIGGEAGELAVDSLRLLRKYVSEQLGETNGNGS